jgi:Zn-dependent M28 family amino/carboxypeptidase
VKRESLEAPNVVEAAAGERSQAEGRIRDHVGAPGPHGVGRAIDGDSINNGAMDDASGIASHSGDRAHHEGRRDEAQAVDCVLAVAAEEKGELGSRYFAMRPT